MKKMIHEIINEEIQQYINDRLSEQDLGEPNDVGFVKKGKIKVGLDSQSTEDRVYVKPNIKIEDTLIDPKTVDFSKYTYIYRITFVDTNDKVLKFSDYIRPNYRASTNFNISLGKHNKQGLQAFKLKQISTDVFIYNKNDEKTPIHVTNIDKYEFKNHDENGYIKLDDDVLRVYKNNVVKTKDDASYTKGGKQVFRAGGKDVNKIDDDYFKGWEEKRVQVGKYKGTTYGELINKDKQYFDWFLQNTKYYKPSPETRYDIPTDFNINLYKFLNAN